MQKQRDKKFKVYFALLLIALIVGLDVFTPTGYIPATLYSIPLFIFFSHNRKRYYLAAVLFLSLLIILAAFFKPALGRTIFVPASAFNRAAVIIAGCILVYNIFSRNRAEEALIKSEQKYRAVFEGSNDPITIIDLKQLQYQEVNQRFSELTGYSREEILAMPAGSLLTPESLRGKLCAILNHLHTTKELIYDWEIQKKTGEIVPVQVSSRVLEIEELSYIFSIFRDMRLVREAQEVLKRDKEMLENIVQERTDALLRAKRLADLGTLAASIAHELRNPLAAIELAKYNIARKAADRDKIARHLEVIGKKVQESSQLIDNMLQFTRLKAPQSQKVNLYQLLQEVEETALALHKGTEIKFINTTEHIKDLWLEFDPMQITQVLDNVINNAYDALASYTGFNGERIIEVTAKTDGRYVTISFRDNGPGIEPGIRERLFEPFYSTKDKGTGLGLAISRQIIENHGGNIRLESEPGQGTAVIISLPLHTTTVTKSFKN